MGKLNKRFIFGAGKTQNLIITQSDYDTDGFMVTIQFCDFVAVWINAAISDNDLIGEMRQIGSGTIKENAAIKKGVCKFLHELGYIETSKRVMRYINNHLSFPASN